ncbi:MAG: hypothetical protein H0V20_07055 [Actinobacteria bacterium]|nr:hypothetical protein [Actinomycetota bacterium]
MAGLRANGFDARIDDELSERRSFELGRETVQVGIWLADQFLEPTAIALAVEAIKAAALRTISKRKKGRKHQRVRKLPIYGSRGQIHGWVELPPEDDAP